MARVKLKFPAHNPLHSCNIPVRISDINYGKHLGNDALLSIIHEARMQLLSKWRFDEMSAGGNSLIMGDVMIAYKGEAYYGDILHVKMYVEEITGRSFDVLYHITTERENVRREIAHAKTGMVCYDYAKNRLAVMTAELKSKLEGEEI